MIPNPNTFDDDEPVSSLLPLYPNSDSEEGDE